MNVQHTDRPDGISAGELYLDPATDGAWWQGRPLDLHTRESRLLFTLASHAGQTVSSETLACAVWGAATPASLAYTALYVRYLQHKLEANPSRPRFLRAVRGGHRLVVSSPAASGSFPRSVV
jgi:DNA-binding response OmpR family regulator